MAVPVYTETVKNQGSNVAFKPITYSQKDVGKTYYYTVKEEIPKDIPAGYTYSQSEYRVKVVVSAAEDGDKDNKLKVVKTITKVTDKLPDIPKIFQNLSLSLPRMVKKLRQVKMIKTEILNSLKLNTPMIQVIILL